MDGTGKKEGNMAEEKTTQTVEETVQTFDDILKANKNYQSEFDKRIAKALETSKAKWEQEAVAKQNEAERLAKLSESEKHAEELKKIQAEKNEAIAKLNAYELKSEAQKLASEKGLDYSLLDVLDYSKESAESIKNKIELLQASVTKATEKMLNERLKQKEPKNVANTEKKKKEVNRASF